MADEDKFKDVKENIEGELEQEESEFEIPDVETGVDGLDQILNGGIPEENLVLVSGGPGSGKTTLGLQFLLKGVKNGETGVYVNLDEKKDKIIRNARLMGWDLEKHVEEENIVFVRPDISDFKKGKREIDKLGERFDADRVVIDSLSVWTSSSNHSEYERRKRITELNQRLERLEATTLSISEAESDSESESRVEEFAVDGIIKLYLTRHGGSFQRGMTVKKMRGTKHSLDLHPVEIGSEGLDVYPDEKLFKEV